MYQLKSWQIEIKNKNTTNYRIKKTAFSEIEKAVYRF